MKRAFIVHGWGGYPKEAWFPWLKKELEQRGFVVQVPAMPDADTPKIETWVPYLTSVVGQPDAETFLIGHSIGVQTILRYLETINTQIGGVVAVAGFFTLIPGMLEGPEEDAIAEPWLTRPIDTEKIKRNTRNVTAIFSDNDPFVGLENVKLFEDRLGAKTIVLAGKGHMGAGDHCPELPEILQIMQI